jgi:CRP-like cAMP-binding protein
MSDSKQDGADRWKGRPPRPDQPDESFSEIVLPEELINQPAGAPTAGPNEALPPLVFGDESLADLPAPPSAQESAGRKPPAKSLLITGDSSFADVAIGDILADPLPATPVKPRNDMMSFSEIALFEPKVPRSSSAQKFQPGAGRPRDDMSFADFAIQEIEKQAAITLPPAPPKPAEKVREVAVNREATLEPRRKDVIIPIDKLVAFRDCIGLFAQLRNKPNVERWPGTLVLRRYHPGEIVFRQGEAGMSAFHVLTAEDEDRLRAARLIPPQRTMIDLETSIETLSVNLAIARPAVKRASWLDRLTGWFAPQPPATSQPRYIPIDAPVGVEHESRRAALSAGDLFGEMSCLYRTPRSATVVAERDCYVLELLRNVLDQLKKDPKFKEEMDRKYKERVFGLQVMNLPLFSGMPAELVSWLRDRAELKSYRAGDIICDENDSSDDMFIIRSGLVKVCQGVSELYGHQDIMNWAGLASQIAHAGDGHPLATLRERLSPETVHRLAAEPNDPTALTAEQWQGVIDALNGLVKGPALGDLHSSLAGPHYQSVAGQVNADDKRRTASERRRLNRALLDDVLAGSVRSRRFSSGPVSILRYASQGDLIGEMGVILNRPRSATCIAYTHPRSGQALEDVRNTEEETVEVVILRADAVRELLEMPGAESVRAQVETLVSQRQKADYQRQKLDSEPSAARRLTPEFERLGLIQGQRLMLIDLDRCTRCDECVRACADTHADGRSRLFLEGPRFERWLVPVTCRSCLDPVCLIGCPVGSIHRGDNRQITIEDWCIGCGLCARQCPYGSIIMHDVGVIGAGARGWRYRGGEIGDVARTRIDGWSEAKAPFRWTRTFRADVGGSDVIWFARRFDVPAELLDGYRFEIELTGTDAGAQVFVNGRELTTTERLKRDKRSFPIAEPVKLFRSKNNIVLVRTSPNPDDPGTIFDLRLDASPLPKRADGAAVEYTEKAVTERAVVCDLCSELPSRIPSCVNACPHDAAIRVDARSEFPE